MKCSLTTPFLALAIVMVCVTAAGQCTLPNCHSIGSQNVFDGNGGPWLSGHVYVVAGNAIVPSGQTLTIQPGAIVKFSQGAINQLQVFGTLKGIGTSGAPILFTSLRDDSGGDHNGDGSSTAPQAGDWGRITLEFQSTACELEWCEIRYASYAGVYSVGPNAVGTRLVHVTTRFVAGDGLRIASGSLLTVDSCTFRDGVRPISGVSAASLGVFVNNTASGNSGGNDLRLADAPATINTNTSWSDINTLDASGVVIAPRPITIAANRTLTLGAGMIFKFDSPIGALNVNGVLLSNGTPGAPVIFTTTADDSVGGDALGNGPTTGSPGAWGYVTFGPSSDASVLVSTEVRYASGPAAVQLSNADVTFIGCRFAFTLGAGLSVGTSLPVVMGSAFDANVAAVTPTPIEALVGFSGNTASGNAAGNYFTIGTGSLSTPLTIGPASAFNGNGSFVLAGTLTVNTGTTLTIAPGVIIKADPTVSSSLSVFGTLHAGSANSMPVVFTSLRDDAIGGDLGNDGGTTTPAAGDWAGLRLWHTADASILENVVVRYGSALASVLLSGCDAMLVDVAIENGAGPGLKCTNSAPTCISCSFDDCTTPVADLPLRALGGFMNCTATGNTMGDVLRIGDGFLPTSLTLQTSTTLNASGVVVLEADVSVSTGATLTLGAGMIFKFAGSRRLSADDLQIVAAAGAQVVFTSIDDDAFGGDSGGDGPTTGSPGDWQGLLLGAGAQTTHLEYVVVRYAGDGQAAIDIAGDGLVLDHVTITSSMDAGIDLRDGARPSVVGCAFVDCPRPVVRASLASLAGFSSCTSSGSSGGDQMGVSRAGNSPSPLILVDASMTLNGNGRLLVENSLSISQATTISAGLLLRLAVGAGIDVNAPLTIAGTTSSPVVVTSMRDDAFGGSDADATAPSKGDWQSLEFFSPGSSSLIENAIIRFGGNGSAATVVLNGASPTFRGVTIENGLGAAIDALFSSSPTLENCILRNNCGSAIDGITWGVLANMRGTTASGNAASGCNDATCITSPFVDGDLVIERDNYFGSAIVVSVTPNVAANGGSGSLSFGRGVVIKCTPGVAMLVEDVRATGYEKAVFTSIRDDEIAGDTNGDGTASHPAPGDWQGVKCDGTLFEHAIIRYAGEPGLPVDAGLQGSILDVRATRVEHSADHGFYLASPNLFPSVVGAGLGWRGVGTNCIAYQNMGVGMLMLAARNCTSAGNGDFGIQAARASYCISWNNGPTGSENYTYTADTVLAPGGTDVVYSCGTSLGLMPPTGFQGVNCGNSGFGNVNVDPLFVDYANGDLDLSPLSPVRNYPLASIPAGVFGNPSICTPWGISGQGYPERSPERSDYAETPRPSDDDFDGPAPFLADLGALERQRHELLVAGFLKLGGLTELLLATPNGVTGTVLFIGGMANGELLVPGWGVLLLEPTSVVALATVPVNAWVGQQIPYVPSLAGFELAVQAVVLPNGSATGSLSSLYRGRFHY